MIKLYNSLKRQVEEFKPLHKKKVGMYTCGPTVYNFATIGNFRTYMMADILLRTLRFNGYEVNYVMNITDVGHLSGDNLGDADTGDDRMEKAAKKEHKTAYEVAHFYTEQFLDDYRKLGFLEPQHFAKATDHIKEQIALVKKLEEKGYTYTISDGVYFDTSRFAEYGQLSDLDEVKEGVRVEINPEKRNARDFALWKFSYPHGRAFDAKTDDIEKQRQMEWESPWGLGFPGWHIECSAMSMKYLGESFDIHTGGIDLKATHHPNEIAQSEAATGKKFVNYWLHGAFILVQGQKMSKSLGNVYRLYDIEKHGYESVILRYLYLQIHYRQEMNFTLPALEAAQNALNHLRQNLITLSNAKGDDEKQDVRDRKKQAEVKSNNEFSDKFLLAINDDLNMPEAVAVMWDMLKSGLSPEEKYTTLMEMDKVLGLNLEAWLEENKKLLSMPVPKEVKELVQVRNQLRREKRFHQADQMRNQILKMGYEIVDNGKETTLRKISE